jgi:hypothetical protein
VDRIDIARETFWLIGSAQFKIDTRHLVYIVVSFFLEVADRAHTRRQQRLIGE